MLISELNKIYCSIQKISPECLGNSTYTFAHSFLNEVALDKIFERAHIYPKIQFYKTEIEKHW